MKLYTLKVFLRPNPFLKQFWSKIDFSIFWKFLGHKSDPGVTNQWCFGGHESTPWGHERGSRKKTCRLMRLSVPSGKKVLQQQLKSLQVSAPSGLAGQKSSSKIIKIPSSISAERPCGVERGSSKINENPFNYLRQAALRDKKVLQQ